MRSLDLSLSGKPPRALSPSRPPAPFSLLALLVALAMGPGCREGQELAGPAALVEDGGGAGQRAAPLLAGDPGLLEASIAPETWVQVQALRERAARALDVRGELEP